MVKTESTHSSTQSHFDESLSYPPRQSGQRVRRATGWGLLLSGALYVAWLLIIGAEGRSILYHPSSASTVVDPLTQYLIRIGNVLLIVVGGAFGLVEAASLWRRKAETKVTPEWVAYRGVEDGVTMVIPQMKSSELIKLYLQFAQAAAEDTVSRATAGDTREERAKGAVELLMRVERLIEDQRTDEAATLLSAMSERLGSSFDESLKGTATMAIERLLEVTRNRMREAAKQMAR